MTQREVLEDSAAQEWRSIYDDKDVVVARLAHILLKFKRTNCPDNVEQACNLANEFVDQFILTTNKGN